MTMDCYPILNGLPDADRQRCLDQALRGEGISAEDAAAMGLSAGLAGMVLLPSYPQSKRTPAQLAVIGGNGDAIDALFALSTKGGDERQPTR